MPGSRSMPRNCSATKREHYEKVTDILDVWFDSGVTHECVLAHASEDRGKPADLYLEGSDQHRGWFHCSLLTGVAMDGARRTRGAHARLHRRRDGRKMSKSLGNVHRAAEGASNTLGADVLRLWVASTDYANEIGVSDEILKRIADAYRRIRNTVRFLLGNLHELRSGEGRCWPSEHARRSTAGRSRARAQLQDEVARAYARYEFHRDLPEGAQLLHRRPRRLVPRRDQGPAVHDAEEQPGRRSAQTALYHIAEAMVRWIAPILSLHRRGDLALPAGRARRNPCSSRPGTSLPEALPASRRSTGTRCSNCAATCCASGAAARAGTIGAAWKREVDVYCIAAELPHFSAIGDELRFLLITSAARVHKVDSRADGRRLRGLHRTAASGSA